MEGDYLQISKHYETCFDEFGDNARGVGWPRERDNLTRFKTLLEMVREDSDITLLDFGCGLSHLYEYLKTGAYSHIRYAGLDISEKFIELSRRKYPQNAYYCMDILKNNDLPSFDYVVMNGVFTQKLDLSHQDMTKFFHRMLMKVFQKARKGIAFNVMSNLVDFKRDGAFHISFDDLATFLSEKLSRNFVIRHDYGLYEFTTYVYSQQHQHIE